ncbi:MAG: GMC family oxidoreductase N-terminal domain-containing protein [Pseudomonadota bacterium]
MSLNELEIRVPDPWKTGLASGWKVFNAATLDKDLTLEADVVIVGTGAGGGTTAEILAGAGLSVIMVEDGMLKTSDSFNLNEREAYRDLYQDGSARATKDGSIGILQGRSVGGTTTVNWTSSFRTPDQTLNYWGERFGVKNVTPTEMAPWFERMEQRLNVHKWLLPPNTNNNLMRIGCEKLGYSWNIIPRNVNGCWNLGYCGMGCPTNAKQSMLVTTIPGALAKGAQLYWRLRAERVTLQGDRVTGVDCVALTPDGQQPGRQRVSIRARHTVVAAGGINTPGLLLRSQLPDPHERIGKRTFLHVVPGTFAQFPEQVDPFYGAPQSVYSDHFQWQDVSDGVLGFKLETMPMHPGLVAALTGTHGARHAEDMRMLPNSSAMLALFRDGFHEQSQGGSVELNSDGAPLLDYPINDYLLDATRRAHDVMMAIQFAAGAKRVRPLLSDPRWFGSLDEARQALAGFEYKPHHVKYASAHVMGGSCMSEDDRTGVCDSRGRVHRVRDLSVFDGSLFPTSIGANPQLSIYGLVARLASNLASELKPA